MKTAACWLLMMAFPVSIWAQQIVADWSRIWGSASNDAAQAVVRDGAGNLYMAGYTYGAFGNETNAGNADLCLVKYSAAGSQKWVRIWGSTNRDEGHAVGLDRQTNVYVAGLACGSIGYLAHAGGSDMVLSKFTPGGAREWVRMWGSTKDDAASGLCLDTNDFIYVAGFASGPLEGAFAYGGMDLCLTKLDSDGGLQWLRLRGSTSADDQCGKGVDLDSSGSLYVAGYTTGPFDGEPFAGVRDACLVKFNAGATQVWTRIFDTTNAEAAGVDVDRFGNIFVTGQGTAFGAKPSAGGFDPFLVKYLPNGICNRTSQWGSVGNDYGHAVRVQGDMYVDVAGAAASGEPFDGVAGTGALFVTRFSTDLQTGRWSARWGASNAAARGVAHGGDDRVYAAGDTSGGFDGQAAAGGVDGFLSCLLWHDGFPPFILSGPMVTNIGTHAATIRWTTDKLSDSEAQYGASWRTFTNHQADSERVTDHELRLTNLVSGHGYNYEVTSTDIAGSNVTSDPGYFSTREVRLPSVFITNMVRIFSIANLIPELIIGISNVPRRLDINMNGKRIGTAYDEPFSQKILPFYQNKNFADYYGSNLVQLVAHAGDTSTACLVSWNYFENCDDGNVSVTVLSPAPRCAVLTTNDVAPSTNLLLEVQARKMDFVADRMIPGLPPGRSGWHEEWVGVDAVEFYLDNVRLYNTIFELPDEHIYYCDHDVIGLATGAHLFAAVARMSNGCSARATRSFTVDRRKAELAFTRDVARLTNYFQVQVGVRNTGNSDIDVNRFRDDLVGFQLLTNIAASVLGAPMPVFDNSHYAPDDRTMHIDFELAPGATLGPGESLVVTYRAVPILYPMGTHIGYAIGATGSVRYVFGEQTRTVELNTGAARVRSPADNTTNTLATAVRAATTNSDYLAVTSPHQLFALHEDTSVDRLLRSTAELAARRQGVVGYQNAYAVVPTRVVPPRQAVMANITGDPAEEVILPDFDDDMMRLYTMSGQLELEPLGTLPFACDLREGDTVAAGNWMLFMPGTNQLDTAAEIIVANGNAHTNPGLVTLYQYDRREPCFWATITNIPYAGGCGFLAGNFDQDNAAGDDLCGDELLLAFPATGNMRIFSQFRTNQFAAGFLEGDLLAAGRVVAHTYDDIVLGHFSSGDIAIFSTPSDATGYAHKDTIHVDLENGDKLAVANVWGDGREEILLADYRSHSIRAYAYFPLEDEFRQVGSMSDVSMLTNDIFIAGDKYRDGYAELAFVRRQTGKLEVFPFSNGESVGNAIALDRMLNQGGNWANQMRTNWYTEGYLLIVGETDIIPAFSCDYYFNYSGHFVRATDRDYARTRPDDPDNPNLTVARIIGDNSDRLRIPVETALENINGGWHFYNTNLSVTISGYDEGASGGSDRIDFWANCTEFNQLLGDEGFITAHYGTDRGAIRVTATNFPDFIRNRAFAFLHGHGNYEHCDVITADDVLWRYSSLSSIRPLVWSESCLTGYYVPGTSLAEAFLEMGVAAYVGATESVIDYNRHYTPTERFIRRMDADLPIAKALRNAKRAQFSYGGTRARQYNGAIYHFYGDPKLNFEWSGGTRRSPSAPAGTDGASFTGPVASIQVDLPGLAVQHTNGVDYVTIPGEGTTGDPGRSDLPIYGVSVTFPPEYTVQDVRMQFRGGVNSGSGLVIPACTPAVMGAHAPAQALAEGDPWWPQSDFEWFVTREADDSATLLMTLYPFFYNSNTTAYTYYSNYIFSIDSIRTPIRIANLYMERSTYDLGDTMRAELWIYNTNATGCDVMLAAAIKSNATETAENLPLRLLDDLAGIASCAIEWDSVPYGAGGYTLEVELLDSSGMVYDRGTLPFSVGEFSGMVTNLAVSPETFYAGEDVSLRADFENTGDGALAGTLIIQVQNEDGTLIEQFSLDFSNLVAGASASLNAIWSNADVPRGNCRIVAYAQYLGSTTEVQSQSVPPADLRFLTSDSLVATPRGQIVRWPSIEGRTYAVNAITNLATATGIPIANALPATAPYNVLTDAVDRAKTIYQVIETW